MIKKRMQSSRPQRSRSGDQQQQSQGNRSNPRQLIEKYKTMAREAASMGDRVEAERYYQLADHYYRVTLASQPVRHEGHIPQNSGQMKAEVQPTPVQDLLTSEALTLSEPATKRSQPEIKVEEDAEVTSA